MAQYDGSITLETKVDTSGVRKGGNNVKKAAGEMSGAFGKMSNIAKKTFSNIKTSALKLGDTMKKVGNKMLTGFKNVTSKISGFFSSIAGKLATLFGIYQIINFVKQSTMLASDLEEVQNVVDVAFGNMSYKMEQFADTAIETYGISKLTAKKIGSSYMAMADGIGIAEEKASDMSLTLTGLTADMASFYNVSTDESKTALAAVFTGETETLKRYGILITEVNLQEYARQQGITKSISKMTQQEKAMLRYNYILQATANAQGDFVRTQGSFANQIRITTERWKEFQVTLGQTFIVVGQLVLPVINVLIGGLQRLAEYIQIVTIYIGKLFGKTITFGGGASGGAGLVNTMSDIASSSEDASSGISDVGKAAGKAAKEVKKSLAGFDELNILTSNASENSENSGGTSGGIGALGAGVGASEMSSDGGMQIQNSTNKISEQLSIIMKLVGGALCAVGVLLMFNGHIWWGIGFIIAGATVFGAAEAQGSDGDPTTSAKKGLLELGQTVGLSLAVLGVILLFFGQWVKGIAFIIAGAAMFGVSTVKLQQGGMKSQISKFLQENEQLIVGVSTALLVIGVALLCFGVISSMSIGLVVAGCIGIAAEITINEGSVGEKISTFLIENAGLITGISIALLVLGVILCVCGVITPLSIGLIVAGAAGLITEIALNWNIITEKVTKFFQDNGLLIAGVGLALVVLGVILCCCGVIPIGIGLIVAGAGSLAAAIAVNWDAITDKVKEIWGRIKEFWNRHIAKIFTAKWWGDLFKKGLNGAIGIFEKFLNFLIDKINVFVRGIDSVVSKVGEVFGADWSVATIPKVSIPRLAKGAVLPANQPFLAMLGDQKNGRNLEAPEGLIRQIFQEEMARMDYNGRGNTPVILELDGRELGRAIINAGKSEGRRLGTKVVYG